MKIQQVMKPLTLSIALLFSAASTAQLSNSWQQQVLKSVKNHPLLTAQSATLAAQQARANSKRQALYNPELSTGFEKEGQQNNYQVGISQTLDWWDKGDVLGRSADYEVLTAQLEYDVVFISTLADLLRSLVTHNAAAKQLAFIQQQEQRVYSLISQIKERRKVGDLGQIDSQLALLTLSKNFNVTAQTIESFEQAKMDVNRLLPTKNTFVYDFPTNFWALNLNVISMRNVNKHPIVLLAQSKWNEQREQANLTKLMSKGDPTIGLTMGRNGNDNTIGVNLSMPLNVRNNYSNEVISAEQDALSLEVLLQNTVNNQRAGFNKAKNIIASYQHRLSYQQENDVLFSEKDNERTIALLKKQWKSGDVNTADYLIAMTQVADGWMATIDLKASYQIATIDYLEQSGLLVSYLSSTQTSSKQ